ncbi:flagellar FlbD family protein [Gorillibacterium timonense]|uniref:flagellar FlbD family protein n=1 Tax=Gorillibacterium timonense TaxID=1689269 RepID=UPI00071E5D21|nr:flagellar FlbD family protein [Gorillibacterium timonense]
MISVTRLNGKIITINALLIESVEETPDTMITLTTGKKLMVLEPMVEVNDKIALYLGQIGLLQASVKRMKVEESE